MFFLLKHPCLTLKENVIGDIARFRLINLLLKFFREYGVPTSTTKLKKEREIAVFECAGNAW